MGTPTKSETTGIRIGPREPFSGGTEAYSGATFERAVTADGRRVILKHLPSEGDWLTRATNGVGRARLLWETGVLDRAGATVDHAVIEVGREGGHDVVVMEDVSDVLLPPDVRLSTSEVEGLLGGLAALHAAFEGCELQGLCSAAARHSLFVPAFLRADVGPNPCSAHELILGGWDRFADEWPADVVDALFALHEDPAPLGRELQAAAPSTLLHGDVKLDNLGLRGNRLVAVDWGELTGTGPAEMDLAWFAAMSTPPLRGGPTCRVDAMPDEVFAVYEAHAARPLDARALDLACLGMVVQLGWLLFCFPPIDDAARARQRELDDWWKARARAALEVWSPT